jgi:hypothetical protein
LRAVERRVLAAFLPFLPRKQFEASRSPAPP